jgi:hypothetical protein
LLVLLLDLVAKTPIASAFALARRAMPASVNTVPPVIVKVMTPLASGTWN